MVLKTVQNKSEYYEIIKLVLDLQKQHVDLFPTLFRDYGDFDHFQTLVKKFDTEGDKLRSEQGLDLFLYFEQDKKIVGCAYVQDKIRKDEFAFVDHDLLFISCFIIDSKYRNQGMGKECLSLLKEWAKEKGYYRMELSVSHQNSSAIALYEDFGFQKEMLYMSCEL